MRLILCLAPIALSACAPDRVQLTPPPVALTQCADEPAAPSLPPVPWASVETARPVQAERDRLMLDYVLRWRTAWGSCRGAVDGIREWREGVR